MKTTIVIASLLALASGQVMVADMTCEEVMNKIYKDSDEAYDAKTDAQKESEKTSFETY